MSRLIYILFFASIILAVPSCSKEEDSNKEEQPDPPKPDNPDKPDKPDNPEYPTFDKPNWTVNYKTYEYSMTAIVQLPDSLSSTETSDDVLALFNDKECRGTGERIHISDKNYVWMVMVYGNKADEELHFMYYSNSNKHKYKSSSTLMFSADTKFGTIDKPEIIPMNIVTDKNE